MNVVSSLSSRGFIRPAVRVRRARPLSTDRLVSHILPPVTASSKPRTSSPAAAEDISKKSPQHLEYGPVNNNTFGLSKA